MPTYLYHQEPHLYDHEATVLAVRPDAILLDRWALHPGGGGQVSDRATLDYRGQAVQLTEVFAEGGRTWHRVDRDPGWAPGDQVVVHIDRDHRNILRELHTATHILNALVYRDFEGSLVTGVQISGDKTARMDFDLPDVDNDRLRALEAEINAVIREGREVRATYVSEQEARSTPGLIRSLSVAPPPTDDGRVRIVEIAGLDRQACGGTHLDNTAESRPIIITKIENKGRQNRRVRLALRGA